jgi:hypothetical protein
MAGDGREVEACVFGEAVVDGREEFASAARAEDAEEDERLDDEVDAD